MPIEVKTTDGMKQLWSMFEDGGATNRLNEVSEAVFDELNTKITVTPSIGLSGVQDAIRQSSGAILVILINEQLLCYSLCHRTDQHKKLTICVMCLLKFAYLAHLR
jgi:hypothetical protein